MKNRHALAALCLMLGLAPASRAQANAHPAPPPEARQFDFWIGEWDVFNTDGAAAGRSRIESIADGHGLLENWTDADGSTGKSLNVYNPATGNWRQFWVGSGTPVLELSGGLQGASMVLSGTRPLRGGGAATDRITWTPNADGSVRQLWEISRDDGRTWSVSFNGLYRRRAR